MIVNTVLAATDARNKIEQRNYGVPMPPLADASTDLSWFHSLATQQLENIHYDRVLRIIVLATGSSWEWFWLFARMQGLSACQPICHTCFSS